MNSNNSVLCGNDDAGLEIDLKDLLACILLCWKSVLACILIFILLGCGVAYSRASTPASFTERLESARSQLTEEQAADVESLRARYVGYQEYQRSLQDDYARYLSNASRASDYVLLNASYYLTSTLEGLDAVLSQTILSEEDFTAMRAVTSEEEDFTSTYGKVKITCSHSPIISGTNNTVVNIDAKADGTPANYYFLVTLYGSSEEECTALLDVVDAAMARSVKSLKSLDKELSLQTAGREFSHNTRDFVNQRITESKNILNDVETQMLNLTNNRISKLSSAEKNYYDLLSSEQQDDTPAVKHVSWKKWSLLGAILGAVLSVGVVFLHYLLDGRVKAPAESETLFRTDTLQRVSIPGKKNLFGRWAARLMGSDMIPLEEKAAILAADLQLLLAKSGHRKLYLLCDPADDHASHVASLVKDLVAARDSSLELIIGNPSGSVSALEQLSASEDVVVFTELKHSSRKLQTTWSELCSRYHLPIIGNVAVEVCW